MIDKKALSDALTELFIGYQHRLDCPMPIPHETEEMIILKYKTDPIFHAKVKSLVSGVMRIVGEHLDGEPVADVLVEALERIANMDSMSYHTLESAKITARNALDVLAAYRKEG